MKKSKLVIVGAFPFMRSDFKENTFFGGILTSSEIIIKSDIFKYYEMILIDSSHNSHPLPTLLNRSYKAIKRILTLIYELICSKPDAALIFASDGKSALEKGLMIVLCNLFRTKVLIFPRAGNLIKQTSESLIFLGFIKFMFKRSSMFLCQGPKWADYASNILKIDQSNILIIKNWTATEDLIKIGEEKHYNNKEEIKILFVGWLEDFKGVYELLNAAEMIFDLDKNISLTFVGNGTAMEPAKRFVKNKRLDGFVKFLGWRSGKDLYDCYENNNVFILPSWSEGLPNAVIEAMAAGLAVITTKVGTIPEVFTNNENSILIEPKNENEIFQSIKRLTINHDLRIKISKNGHIFSKYNFSSTQTLKLLDRTIQEIIKKG